MLGTTNAPGTSTTVPAPPNLPAAAGTFIRAEISLKGGPASWVEPSHAYFLREGAGWRLVGFERVPGGNAPNSARD